MAAAAIPAVGAIAGGLLAKRQGANPLLGAAMGGLGGYALGPAMAGASGALGAAGAAGASPLAAGAYGAALPGLGAQQAAMLAAQTGGFGSAGLGSTIGALGGSGGAGVGMLGNAMANPQLMGKVMGQAAQMAGGGQQQPMPMSPPPMPIQPQANRANPGTMASRGQTGNMYQPRRTSLLG